MTSGSAPGSDTSSWNSSTSPVATSTGSPACGMSAADRAVSAGSPAASQAPRIRSGRGTAPSRECGVTAGVRARVRRTIGIPRTAGVRARIQCAAGVRVETGVRLTSAALGRGTYVSRAAWSVRPANRSFIGSAAWSCVRAPRRRSPAAPRTGLRPAPAAGRRGLVRAPAEPWRGQPATPTGPAPKGHAPVPREPACHPATSNHACPYFGSRPFTGARFGGGFLPFPNGP